MRREQQITKRYKIGKTNYQILNRPQMALIKQHKIIVIKSHPGSITKTI